MQADDNPLPQEEAGAAAAEDPPEVPRPATSVSWTKLFLVVCLGGLALCLQVTTWTLEVLVEERRRVTSARSSKGGKRSKPLTRATPKASSFSTVRSSETTEAATLHTQQQHQARSGTGVPTQAAAYWETAVHHWLASWDPNSRNERIEPLNNRSLPAGYHESPRAERDRTDTGYHIPTTWATDSATTTDEEGLASEVAAPIIIDALEEAARRGHAAAQFHVANAYAAGFWPLDGVDASTLQVEEAWTAPTSHQQHQAFLYWRLAAQQGHVESTMATAHRLETLAQSSSAGDGDKNSKAEKSKGKDKASITCWKTLPFWEAAAAGIIDQLEADSNSRAKVLPATDKHELHTVHLHGGSNSQLDQHNRADESTDALQFYHLRATNLAGTEAAAAAQAAFTLAQYYHYGIRGVVQNVTLAADYYRMAAEQNHWEAAGQLGKFYLWGIGVPQDPYVAQRYFIMGVPAGLYDCQSRYARLAKQTKKKDSDVSLCEANCLNGIALIKILGLPHVSAVDLVEAEAYLGLARDQGSGEAAYNLAMLRLGWKQHWKLPEAVAENGQTILKEGVFAKEDPLNHPSQTEYQTVLSDLRLAASKGHMQAQFRLGLLYSTGASIPKQNMKIQVISKDCEKATKHMKWVVDTASPDRARRMRYAYQQYVAGDTASSLRNYLAAAATGSETAQLNAAFLLERGECAGLASAVDCAKASVRLWKAAAERGQSEASLRVGDFYYFGRLRPTHVLLRPFGWTRYIMFPEELISLYTSFWQYHLGGGGVEKESEGDVVCEVEDENTGTCLAATETVVDVHSFEKDLETAAHYYQLAANSKDNGRANFNLGFLYEWGLGLKQDFPLSKRHYDLAKSAHSRGSDVPVAIALFALNLHERVVKFWMTLGGWMVDKRVIMKTENMEWPSPGPSANKDSRHPSHLDKTDVILAHVFSWDSLLIVILTILFFFLIRCGTRRQ
jgi:TPR repeat protein